MLISKCHLMGPFRAFLKPLGPQSPWAPGSLYPPAPPLGGTALHTFTVPVQVFLVLLQ